MHVVIIDLISLMTFAHKHNLKRSGRTRCLSALGAPLIKIEPELRLYSDNYHVHEHTGHRRATLLIVFLFIQISLHKNIHRGVGKMGCADDFSC